MPEMSELFSQKRLVDYTLHIQEETRPLAEFFPEQKAGELTLELFKGANNLVADVAPVQAFGAKAEERQSIGGDVSLQDMLLTKQKVTIKERDLIRLEETTNDLLINQIKNTYVNELVATIRAVFKTFEVGRGQILYSGKWTPVVATGGKIEVDYHRSPENEGELDLTDDKTNPLDVLEEAMDYIEDITNGERPTRIIAHPKIIRAFVNHPLIRSSFLGLEKDKIIPVADLNGLMQSIDMPTFAPYNGRYRVLQKDGTFKSSLIIPDDKMILLPPHAVGDTFYGPTAEGRRLRKHGIEARQEETFATTTYVEGDDPPTESILTAATGLISAPYIDETFVYTTTTSK